METLYCICQVWAIKTCDVIVFYFTLFFFLKFGQKCEREIYLPGCSVSRCGYFVYLDSCCFFSFNNNLNNTYCHLSSSCTLRDARINGLHSDNLSYCLRPR